MPITYDKKRFISLLIAIYFIAYTVYPLTYPLSNHQVPEDIGAINQESSNTNKDHLLLRKLFIKKSPSPEQGPHNHGNNDVLIKKRRAIVPEDDYLRIFSNKHDVMLVEYYDPPVPSPHSLHVQDANFLGVYKGFNPVCSGHSPPSV
jgi:hypothetical protein